MSLRTKDGQNLFAISDSELANGGRKGAANDDTKYMSKEGEMFLAGVLDGLPDGVLLCFIVGCDVEWYLHSRPIGMFPPNPPTQKGVLTKVRQLVPTINGYKRLVGGEVSLIHSLPQSHLNFIISLDSHSGLQTP